MGSGSGGIALSELVGGLSYALDVAEGEPQGHAKRSCLIGMRLSDELALGATERSDLFYALLLKDAGCTANSAHMAALFGADDQVAKRTSKFVDWSRPLAALLWSLRTVAPGESLKARAERLWAIHNEGEVTRSLMLARCYRGAEIARKLGFSEATADAIRALDEHWDGRGQPHGLRGTEIPLAGRILCLSQTVEVFQFTRGAPAACQMAASRSGQWFDPELVEALLALRDDTVFWASLADPDVSAVEPPDRVLTADDDLLDRIAEAFAQVVDAKSGWTHEHGDRVYATAIAIASRLGLDRAALRDLGRAALLHDIGKLAISNRILDKPGPLTEAEFTNLKSHPLLTERILQQVPSLTEIAQIASAHHERLDGGGYPRGLTANQLTTPMRVLAVADVFSALTADRPYRPAYSAHHALELMRADVPRRLDGDAFAALEMLVVGQDVSLESGGVTGQRPTAPRLT